MTPETVAKGEGFEIVDFARIPPAQCPCGPSRRAFVDNDGSMSVHQVSICEQDTPHHHKTDEVYIIQTCGPNAAMILNGKRYPVQPGMAIKIKGGTRHCADGGKEPMVVLVVVATGHGSPQATMEFD